MSAANYLLMTAAVAAGVGLLLDAARALGQPTPAVSANQSGIKGKITYDGTPPELKPLSELRDFKAHTDRTYCEQGPVNDPTWIVGPGKEVANVVVWLRTGEGTLFQIPEKLRQRNDTVVVDQAFCAFAPHVAVLFPAYRDLDGQLLPTGQKFVVRNSARVNHHVRFRGSIKDNFEQSVVIPAKRGDTTHEKEFNLRPDPQPITLNSDLHKWMKGYVIALDHPYASISNDKGEYRIAGIPGNAEVFVVAWHEDVGYLLPRDKPSATGQPIRLDAGKITELQFSIKK